jgi:NAD(P)-dependent dehydrogenase (short-subunit alcohol dehydrogenase family)
MSRVTLVTGVSRRRGIGFAIAQRLLREDGARVFAHSYAPYDATQPWGAGPGGINTVFTALGGESDRLAHAEADLADPSAPERLISQAVERLGTLDALVLNHARSQRGTVAELDASTLDLTWAINVRAALLLVRAFAAQHRRRFPTPSPRARCTRSPRRWPTRWPSATSRSTASIPDPRILAGPARSRTRSSSATCPAAGGTPPPRRLTSSPCCYRPRPRRSPARSSTPRAGSGASHPRGCD